MIKKKQPNLTIDAFDFPPGKTIAGKYKIISKLGAGWEGEVYMVSELNTGIERAAKIFYPQRNIRDRAAKFYANKFHKLRQCSILIQYHTREEITYRKAPITVLISEYVEGELLSNFLSKFRGKRLEPFISLHLLYSLVKGMEEIHLLNEYHGDLHLDNIIVNKFGLNFEIKLLDFFHYGASKSEYLRDDIVDLVKIFHEVLGGKNQYPQHPQSIKYICCGLKKSLIIKKFKTISQLRCHLETMDYEIA